MRAAFIFGVLVVVAVIVTGSLMPRADASTGRIPLNCNRACLENVIDQYLAAVVAHNPEQLPLSDDVMYTENDQVIKVGDGFWKPQKGGATIRIFLPIRSSDRLPTWEPCAKRAGLY
jgi:hypothetical protein